MLDRQHLEILRAIATYGTLTKAAPNLFLSQSALSHAIKKLEEQLGVALWRKEGRQLRLTAAGEHLLACAKRLLPQLEHAEESVKRLGAGEMGHLRIGMECHPCYQWLLRVVRPYLARCPEIDIDVKRRFQFSGISALLQYEIDVLITPDPVRDEKLHFLPVFPYELVLVCARDHPLAAQKCVFPEQLRAETLITYPVAYERLDIFSQFLFPANVAPKAHKCVETTEIIFELVLSGRGVTAMPLWLAQDYHSEALYCLPLGTQGIHKHIHIGTRAAEEPSAHIQTFIALARELS